MSREGESDCEGCARLTDEVVHVQEGILQQAKEATYETRSVAVSVVSSRAGFCFYWAQERHQHVGCRPLASCGLSRSGAAAL